MIGISLGTTYVCVASAASGVVSTTPAFLSYNPDDGTVTVGKTAMQSSNPLSVIAGARALLGRKYSQLSPEWLDVMPWRCPLTDAGNDVPGFVMPCGRIVTAVDAIAHVIGSLNIKSADVVVAVPADFTVCQRADVVAACRAGGLVGIIRIVDEPTAAYSMYCSEMGHGRIAAVVDMGATRSCVSLVDCEKNGMVLACAGRPFAGGNDIDAARGNECDIRDIVRDMLAPSFTTLATCRVRPENITDVILCGGTCKLPMVAMLLKEVFPCAKVHCSIDPAVVIAMGAFLVPEDGVVPIIISPTTTTECDGDQLRLHRAALMDAFDGSVAQRIELTSAHNAIAAMDAALAAQGVGADGGDLEEERAVLAGERRELRGALELTTTTTDDNEGQRAVMGAQLVAVANAIAQIDARLANS